MVLLRIGVDKMAEHFTRPNIEKVVGKLGTTPEQRGLSTQEFKDKFDEMPEAIQQYIKETLLAELDAFKEEFTTLKNEFLGRIEYLLLDPRSPEETAHRFNVPPRTNKFFVLNQKQNGFTTVISVSSYSTDGIVWTVLNNGAAIAITTNADRTAIFFRPEHSTRGFVITTTGV